MKDTLPVRPKVTECAVVNLDTISGPGTHWTAYYKCGLNVYYFDSYGNLKPPKELISYFGEDSRILYNHDRYQRYKDSNCGHLCLKFLYNQFYM